MKEEIPDDIEELPDEIFWKIFRKLGQRPGNKYNFITKAGYGLQLALLNLFKIIWRSEQIPFSWQESKVTQLPKSAGRSNCLENKRHIHERDSTSKFLSQIVLSHAKEILYKKICKNFKLRVNLVIGPVNIYMY